MNTNMTTDIAQLDLVITDDVTIPGPGLQEGLILDLLLSLWQQAGYLTELGRLCLYMDMLDGNTA